MSINSTRIAGLSGLVLLILAGFWLADNNPSSGFNGLSVLSNEKSGEESNDATNEAGSHGVINQRESIVRTGNTRGGNRDRAASSTQENTDPSSTEPASGSETTQDSAAEDPESPEPPAEVLSAEVYNVINEVQTRFLENQFEEGLNELNALYLRYDELNDFEKATVLNFYSNALLSGRMLPEAILVFEQLLTVNNLRDDIHERALRSLGQLNMAEQRYGDSIRYYNQYLEINSSRDASVLLGLANAHYSLQQYDQAIPFLVEHIQSLQAAGTEVTPVKYSLLTTMAALTENTEVLSLLQEFLSTR